MTNEDETTSGKLYYIHLHSQSVRDSCRGQKLDLQKVSKPFMGTLQNWYEKKTCLRSQFYIKLTRSSYVQTKHHLKYFCLKCHIWWKINKTNFLFGVIRSVSVLFILFFNQCHAKCVIGFSLFSRDPDSRLISNFYRFVSLCIWLITSNAYTASNCFVSKNQFHLFLYEIL